VTAKKTTRITIESELVSITRLSGSLPRSWCQSCGAEVEMLSLEQASGLARVLPHRILASSEAKRLHATQALDGSMQICLPSLLKCTWRESQP
jgi:hypothetical protein